MKQSTQKTLLVLAFAGVLGGTGMLAMNSDVSSLWLIADAQAAEDGHGGGHSGGHSGGRGGMNWM